MKYEKRFERWPRSSYTLRIASVKVQCEGAANSIQRCDVTGIIDFSAQNITKRSVGATSFEYTFVPYPTGIWVSGKLDLRISYENGFITQRQVTELTKPNPCAGLIAELLPFIPKVFKDCGNQP